MDMNSNTIMETSIPSAGASSSGAACSTPPNLEISGQIDADARISAPPSDHDYCFGRMELSPNLELDRTINLDNTYSMQHEDHNYCSGEAKHKPKNVDAVIPVQLEYMRGRKRARTVRKHNKTRTKKRRTYERFNCDSFVNKFSSIFSPVVMELNKMDLMKKKMKKPKYSQFQKWLSVNFMVASTNTGYNVLSKMLPLPSMKTCMRELKRFKSFPGISSNNARLMRLKVSPTVKNNNLAFLLFDEMSLRSGLHFHQPSDTIYGFEDDGKNRSSNLVTSVLCVMAVGVVQKWKYPLGFFLTSRTMKSEFIRNIVATSIRSMESEGFHVLGVTSDQGPNFEKTFRLMGASEESPKIKLYDKRYFVLRDPPHLIKSARNYLLNGDVKIPGNELIAKWTHLKDLYSIDSKNSFKLAPKLTESHVCDLKRSSKMKVKLASQSLSHSVSSALCFLVSSNLIDASAAGTSEYCKKFNDLFDAMNSSSSADTVSLRRPLSSRSSSVEFLNESLSWLVELEKVNSKRRCHFIRGFRQNIVVLLELNQTLNSLGIPYLSTRNLCQDPLENFFGKIRQLTKFPDSFAFSNNYSKLASGSLVSAPLTGNCEAEPEENDHLTHLMNYEPLPEPEAEEMGFMESEVEAAVTYSGSPSAPVGGLFDSIASENAASYFAGYIAMKLEKYHCNSLKSKLTDCEKCSSILSTQDLNLHLFISFKEYKQNVDSS